MITATNTDTLESDQQTPEQDNGTITSRSELIASLVEQSQEKTPDVPDTDQPEDVDVVQEPEAELQSDNAEGETKDVLSQSSTDAILEAIREGKLSEEELKALNARAVSRFGDMTRKLREQGEELERLKAQDTPEDKPVVASELNRIQTKKELQEFQSTQEELLEFIDDTLESKSYADDDDIVYQNGDVRYTKKELRELKRSTRKLLRTDIQQRAALIEAQEQNAALAPKLEEAAIQQIPWLVDDESEEYKAYERIRKDPVVKAMYKSLPQHTAWVDYVVKHAVNSIKMSAAKEKAPPAPKQTAKVPPQPGMGSAGVSAPRGHSSVHDQLKKASERFQKTNSKKDLINLITLQNRIT